MSIYEFAQPFQRRDLIRASLACGAGISLSGWLPTLARAAQAAKSNKGCILLWMSGGPSQLDTFDPKPGRSTGGPFKSISTSVSGIQICEHLPGIARHMQDLSIIRDMNTVEADHGRGAQLMLTGYKPNPALEYPSLGSLLGKELGAANNELPNYVSLSSGQRFGNAGGPGFLGPQYAPLVVTGSSADPNARANLTIENLQPPAGVTPDVMRRRFDALALLQREFDGRYGEDAARAHRTNWERAVRIIESHARNAFKLDEEQPKLRDAYGRNRFGQGCLLARRLLERGVTCVEVELAGIPGVADIAWDTHIQNFERVRSLCGVLDAAWSTLMSDLKDRGMLESTLVLWMGEFGRTPTINANAGRDHWAAGWSAVLGGGGIRGGGVIGDTGPDGTRLQESPGEGTTVADLYATIWTAAGIDPAKENIMSNGRPIKVTDDGAEPIADLLS